jgi:hypothetical protein
MMGMIPIHQLYPCVAGHGFIKNDSSCWWKSHMDSILDINSARWLGLISLMALYGLAKSILSIPQPVWNWFPVHNYSAVPKF